MIARHPRTLWGRRIWLALSLLPCLVTPLALVAQDASQDSVAGAPPGTSLSVYLLTAEPGDAIWELFGHNALLVRDAETGFEAAYNYGLFDMFAPGFVPRFLRGEMMYAVGAVPLDAMLHQYRAANRKVWAQELDLEPDERLELFELLSTASLPENRFYRYEYFLNNCSTKLRDALDVVLDGQIRRATEGQEPATTWRTHTRRLTAPSWFGYTGIQLLLGPKGDEGTTPWDEMWVPMKLRDVTAGLTVAKPDGSRVPLVRSEELWVDSTREPELVSPPGFNALFPLAGLGLGILVLLLGHVATGGSVSARFGLALVGVAWGVFCGAVAILLVGVHWTDHEFMYLNQNVLLFSPLGLGLAVLMPRVAYRLSTGRWVRRMAALALALSCVGLLVAILPSVSQGNGEWIAFALPVHLSLWWVLKGVVPAEDALVYA